MVTEKRAYHKLKANLISTAVKELNRPSSKRNVSMKAYLLEKDINQYLCFPRNTFSTEAVTSKGFANIYAEMLQNTHISEV